MIMAGEGGNFLSGLPIPDPNRLVVTGTNNPGQLFVEERCADVVLVTLEREKQTTLGERPHSKQLVITAGHEHVLRRVHVKPAHGTFVTLESVDDGTHPVVPELDGGRVQCDKDPRPRRMERDCFRPRRPRLEFREHTHVRFSNWRCSRWRCPPWQFSHVTRATTRSSTLE